MPEAASAIDTRGDQHVPMPFRQRVSARTARPRVLTVTGKVFSCALLLHALVHSVRSMHGAGCRGAIFTLTHVAVT